MSANEGTSARHPERAGPKLRAALEELASILGNARETAGARDKPVGNLRFPAAREDGVIGGFAWTEYDSAISRFWSIVHQLGNSAEPFDWPAWLNQIRASGADPLDPALVANLSLQDLGRYLTALERAERFTDGTWRAAIDRGVLEAVLRRIIAWAEK